MRSALSTGGRWKKYDGGSGPLYSPPSVEVAKRFHRSVSCLRSRSLSLSDTPLTSRQDKAHRMSRLAQCHGCHGMLGGGLHVGSAIGKNVCTFSHSSLCRGGIPESDGWRGCPLDFEPIGATSAQFLGPADTSAHAQDILPADFPSNNLEDVFGTPRRYSSNFARGLDDIEQGADLVRFQRQANGEGARSKVTQDRLPGRVWFGEDELPQQVEQEVSNHRAVNQQASQMDLHHAAQLDLTIKDIRNIPGLRDEVESTWAAIREHTPCLSSAPSAPAPGIQGVAADFDHMGGIRVTGHEVGHEMQVLGPNQANAIEQQIVEARAKYAAVLEKKKLADQQISSQQAAAVQQQQADAVQQQQAAAVQQQQAAVLQQQQAAVAAQARARDELLQFQRITQDAEAQLLAAQNTLHNLRLSQSTPVAAQPPRQSVLRQTVRQLSPVQSMSGPYVGHASLPQPINQGQHEYETVVGADGRKYKVPKSQMTQIPEFEIVTGSDGRQYRVARSHMSSVQSINQHPVYHHQPSPHVSQQVSPQLLQNPQSQADYPWLSTLGQSGRSQQAAEARTGQPTGGASVSDQIKEKMQGIVNLVDGEGTRKPSKLMDHVRRCPAKWCKTVKPNSMNLPVFAYGAISELTASLSGRTDPITKEVLLSKLQHIQNVFEICCINSSEADFSSYGWVLARDYALKVNERVDQQMLSWGTLSQGIQTDILVSSQMEYPRPQKANEDLKDRRGDKPLCTTFNKCSVEGKCDWEVSNPGRTCQRRHECSYCRRAKNQYRKHQESRCTVKTSGDK